MQWIDIVQTETQILEKYKLKLQWYTISPHLECNGYKNLWEECGDNRKFKHY